MKYDMTQTPCVENRATAECVQVLRDELLYHRATQTLPLGTAAHQHARHAARVGFGGDTRPAPVKGAGNRPLTSR